MVEFKGLDDQILCTVNNGVAQIGYLHKEEFDNEDWFYIGTGYCTGDELRQIANKLDELNA